ncbi:MULTISPECIES: wax ester/triacylglycerol synthase family O-acyltransferase [unclassified Phycicoccus]|uniref:WS/DGAT/MGAT family O-acyltransferase n=1 Tax=unclassified Phycicoccus TaxID=2637926 RepID=UPI000702BB5B|nr:MULTISPECIES: wax ester/triacylglycerol synthase family O-acyltransferase [unclassified Phycicoccus]KRF25445.1 acyltransferase [Phycicoccus sp. Soil803]KRF27943.1 acyltransferase [Phycicoccus sp. Soil802]
MDRMSAMDAMFYYMEGENTPMHVGGVSVLEGPAPAYGDLVRLLAAKMDQVPRYRQVIRTVPFQLGRPIWVDDPHFQLLYHVRHTSLPKPGGPEQLRNLAGRVFAQRLDMTKPVWEAWLVEGLAEDRWALISKAHHCMIDGEGSTDLMQVIFDLEPEPVRREPSDWTPSPAPSTVALTAGSVVETVREPLQAIGIPSLDDLAKLPTALAGVAVAAKELVPQQIAQLVPGRGQPTPKSLNGPLGPNRRWVWTDATMGEVKTIRTALGGTVNDVILAAVTRGYRDLVQGRGELVPEMVVRSLVPVSTRQASGRGQVNNQVTSVVVDLPVAEDDPVRRLQLIREQMDRNKRGMGAVDAAAIVGLADYAAPTLLALGARSMSRMPNKLTQTGTTNVPGPRIPLYLLGHQLLESHPYVPVFAGVRVATGIFSYLDTFSFGITADFDSFPDVEVIADGIRAGFNELVAAAVSAADAPRP